MELLLSGIEASAPIIDAASVLVSARQSMGGIHAVGAAKVSNKRPRKKATTTTTTTMAMATTTNQGRRFKKHQHQQQHQAKLKQAAMMVFGSDVARGEWPATSMQQPQQPQQGATALDSHSLFQQLQKPQPSATLQSQQHSQLFQHQQYQLQLQQQLERQQQQQARDHHSQSYDSQSHQSQHQSESYAQPDAQRHTAVIRPGSSIVPEPYQRQPHLLEIDPRLRGMPGVPALMQGETVRPMPTIRPKTNARFPSPAFPSHDERVPMWSPQQLQQQQQQQQQEAYRQQVQEAERQRRQQQQQRQIKQRHAQQVQHQQLQAQQVLAHQKKIQRQQAQQKHAQQLQQNRLLQDQLREAQHRKQQQHQQQQQQQLQLQQQQQLQLKRAQTQQLQLQQQQLLQLQQARSHQQQSLQAQVQRHTYQQPPQQRQQQQQQQPSYSVHDQVQTQAYCVKPSDQHERLQLWQKQALGIQSEPSPQSLSQGLSLHQHAQAVDDASRQQRLRVQHSLHRQPPPSARDGYFEQALWTNQEHRSPAASTITSNFQRLQPTPEAGAGVDTRFPLAALPSLQFRSLGGDWVQPLASNGSVFASRQDGMLASSVSTPNTTHLQQPRQQTKPATSAGKRAGRLTAGSMQTVGSSSSTGQQSDPLNGVRHGPQGSGTTYTARPASSVVPGLGIAQSQNQKILSNTRLRKIAKKTSRKERQQLQQTLKCQPPGLQGQPPLSQDKYQSSAVNALNEHQERPPPPVASVGRAHKKNGVVKPRKRKASIPVPMPQKAQEPMSIPVALAEVPRNGIESHLPAPSDPHVDHVRTQSAAAATPDSPMVSHEISDPTGLLAIPSARPATETVMIFCKRDFLRFQAGQLWRKYREIKRKRDLTLATVTGRRARYLNARYQNPDPHAVGNSSETSHARQAAAKRVRHSIETTKPSSEETGKGEAGSSVSPAVGSIIPAAPPLCVSTGTEKGHEEPLSAVDGSAHEPTSRDSSLPEEPKSGVHVGDVQGGDDTRGTTTLLSDSSEDIAVKNSPIQEATVTQSTGYTASSCAGTTFVIIDEDTFATGTTSSESSATMEHSPPPACAVDHKPPVLSLVDNGTMESGRNSDAMPPVAAPHRPPAEPLGVSEPLAAFQASVASSAMYPMVVPHPSVSELHFSDTSGPQRSTIPGIRDEVVI